MNLQNECQLAGFSNWKNTCIDPKFLKLLCLMIHKTTGVCHLMSGICSLILVKY